ILDIFFETNTFHIKNDSYILDLVPERLRGEIAFADITDKAGKVIVAKDRRISKRHVDQLKQAGINKLEVPTEYLLGKVIAKHIVDKETGDIIAEANTEITTELLNKIKKAGISTFGTLFTNDLDRGAYISDTLKIDPTTNQIEALVEIYRMMRPGEP